MPLTPVDTYSWHIISHMQSCYYSDVTCGAQRNLQLLECLFNNLFRITMNIIALLAVCDGMLLWLPWQRDSNMVRVSMPWHHHIYKLLPPLPVSELVHTYRHVAWSFWTRVEVPVVFGKQINIVENIAIPLMEVVGHDETNIKQHGTIEGRWVSLSMKKQIMSFFIPLRLCENGRNFEGKIFEFSSFNENSWLKLHSCLFLRFQWPVSQRWLRWQAKSTLSEAIFTKGSGCMTSLSHSGYSGLLLPNLLCWVNP